MCGIFGIIADQHHDLNYSLIRHITNKLFLLSESRGKESAGISVKYIPGQTISILKRSIPASNFVKSNDYNHFFASALQNGGNLSRHNTTVGAFAIIAHARLVTNGTQEQNHNNQPVIKDGCVVVHNGIVTNVDELWNQHRGIERLFEVDTEIIASLIRRGLENGQSIETSVSQMFMEMEGSASVAAMFDDRDTFLLATNTGSTYYAMNDEGSILIFASERIILKRLIGSLNLKKRINLESVAWLKAGHGLLIDFPGFRVKHFQIQSPPSNLSPAQEPVRKGRYSIRDYSPEKDNQVTLSAIGKVYTGEAQHHRLLEYNHDEISHLRRCSKCILPETFPFIEFDEKGVCNYCKHHVPKSQGGRVAELHEILAPHRKLDGEPDCIVAFSGGRDSCYGLHYIVKELKMHPITFTYDWGMITDLARRNCARVCGKLGIENILISADIRKKRDNIRKNVSTWLKRPDLGIIPLFMAGDKHFFYYVSKLREETGIQINIWSSNHLENTHFKVGLCGVRPSFERRRIDYLSLGNKIRLSLFYMRHFLASPSYFNSSIIDTITSFYSYYAQPRIGYYQLFDFIKWDEEHIVKTLIDDYNWEISPDTTSTWRIGDGTAAFYNYCYCTIAGFSEIDTFRSNQIREGMLDRERALTMSLDENRPRYESIRWYLDTINLDFEDTIKRINAAPKYYRQG